MAQAALREKTGPPGKDGTNGIDGKDGTVWFEGSGLPTSDLGEDKDFYINRKNGDFFENVSGKWIFKGNLKGPKGKNGEDGKPGRDGVTSHSVSHFTKKGRIKFVFNSVSLDAGENDTILEHTVPSNRNSDCLTLLVSGENIGEFTVFKVLTDTTEEQICVRRTNYTKFEREIPLERLTLDVGEKLRVKADNVRTDEGTALFEATLFHDEYSIA